MRTPSVNRFLLSLGVFQSGFSCFSRAERSHPGSSQTYQTEPDCSEGGL